MEKAVIVQKYTYKKGQFANVDHDVLRLSIDMPEYMLEDFEIFMESLNLQIEDCENE